VKDYIVYPWQLIALENFHAKPSYLCPPDHFKRHRLSDYFAKADLAREQGRASVSMVPSRPPKGRKA